MTTPLKAVFDFINEFREHKKLFLIFFNISFIQMTDPNLWYRDKEIMMNNVKYVLDANFWNNIIDNSINEQVLLKAFYTHSDTSIIEDKSKSELLLEVLKKYKCSEILKIISNDFKPFTIDKKDISQFSDFSDAYYMVPYLLAYCGKT